MLKSPSFFSFPHFSNVPQRTPGLYHPVISVTSPLPRESAKEGLTLSASGPRNIPGWANSVQPGKSAVLPPGTLHNNCTRRLTGGNAYLQKCRASCAPKHLCRLSQSGNTTIGKGYSLGRQKGPPRFPAGVPNQLNYRRVESPFTCIVSCHESASAARLRTWDMAEI